MGNPRSNPAPARRVANPYDTMRSWCPIGDAKPAPEPADRKRVGRVAVVGAWPPVFDAAAVHAGPSCGADPRSAGARQRRSFRRALERIAEPAIRLVAGTAL